MRVIIPLGRILTHYGESSKKHMTQNATPSNFIHQNRWLFALLIIGALFYLLAPVLMPFFLAAIIAYMCDPLVDRLSEVGYKKFILGRSYATLLVMFGLVGAITALFLVLVPLLQKESLLIAERLPTLVNKVHDQLEPWLQAKFGVTLDIDGAMMQEILTKNWKTAGGILGDVLKSVGGQGLALIGFLANILLLPVVLFYLLRDWDNFVATIGELIPRDWYEKVKTISIEIDDVLSEFVRGQFSVMAAMSIFYTVGLWLAGLDMALPIGLVTGLLGFVPYLGIATGIGLAMLVAALQFTSLQQVVPVLLVFGLGQVVEGMILTPKLVGDRIGLHPVIVIFALLAGGQLFGFIGILLALPVSAAIAVGLRHSKQHYLNSKTYQNY
jgi:predicted PurR-regulated permease PerM